MKLGKLLKTYAKEKNLTPVVIGHSHGGGLAQVAAAKNGIKGVVFNPRPMGAGVRRYIGSSKIAENAKQIAVFSAKGDWVSGTRPLNVLAAIFERITGIVMPRSVGVGYILPSVSSSSNENEIPWENYEGKSPKNSDLQHGGFYHQMYKAAGFKRQQK